MPAMTPEEIHPLFLEAFRAKDLERLLEFYTDDVAVIVQPGQILRGQAQAAIEGFLALGELTLDSKLVLTVGDIAYLSCTWSISGTGPDGNPLALGGTTAEVAQRQEDGSWRYIIDNPWGEQALVVDPAEYADR